jgi:RecA/RadA recombinase
MSLLKRLIESSAKGVDEAVLTDSDFYTRTDDQLVTTPLPTFNIALSGSIKGGLAPGITIATGESGTGKSLLGLVSAKAFLDKFKEGVVLFYDSEGGLPAASMRAMGIDVSRIIHIPVYHVEQLKFDLVQRFETVTPKDKVFVLVDSLGLLASKKEVEDAENEKSVADMSRAKAIRSMFRIVLPHFTNKGIYSYWIAHAYDEQGLFPKKVLGGGTAVKLVANLVMFFSKSQEKDGTDLAGFNINISIMKSRFIREKAKLSMLLRFDGGFDQFSGIVDLAVDAGLIIKPSNGYYQLVDTETGELLYDGKKFRMKDIQTPEYLVPIMRSEKFKRYIRDEYCLANDDKQTLVEMFDINDI